MGMIQDGGKFKQGPGYRGRSGVSVDLRMHRIHRKEVYKVG